MPIPLLKHIITSVLALITLSATAVPDITIPLGTFRALSDAEILSVNTMGHWDDVVCENGEMKNFLFDGGYVNIDGDTIQFHYYTKDHLGSNRTLVHENGTVEQVVHYYPFGGTYADAGVNWSLQMYKYNGKELDRMHGLDWYDYGARMYDAVLIGWTSMDPLAEEYYHVSPYAYCLNNPVNAVDPDGRKVRIYGNRSERIQILTYLQMLTNDKLGVNQNGFVIIMNKNSKNQDKNLEVGTKLLGSIVNDSHLVWGTERSV